MSGNGVWLAKFFGGADKALLTTADVALLDACFRSIPMEAGTVLFSEGSIPKGVWIVQSGAVELVARVGGRSAVIRMVGLGESVGDIQALSRKPAPYKARTATRSVTLFASGQDLDQLLARSPSVARRWISKLTLQVARNQDRIVELLSGSLEQKVARVLCQESRDDEFCFSQSTLASMLGVHRSSVSSLLKDFEAQGLLEMSYRRIRILDAESLSAIACGSKVGDAISKVATE
ncbi:MAG: Crp/Fnr family transcriptional regulator, partial [Actinomycetota bacterium]|nr:Crp/Fnr family transcriptional regulator [Actinomycetota bacterium]